jgi:hypothetical protein
MGPIKLCVNPHQKECPRQSRCQLPEKRIGAAPRKHYAAAPMNGCSSWTMDPTKVAQIVNVLNGLTARDALCLSVGCMLAVLDETPSDEERQQSLEGCIDLLRCTNDRL